MAMVGDMNSKSEKDSTAFNLQQQAILLLWQRVNVSLTAFYKLTKYYGTAQLALQGTETEWKQLGIHSKHLTRHSQSTTAQDNTFLAEIESRIASGEFNMVFQQNSDYPQQLLTLFDPPPLLFYRGNIKRLNQPQIAIVGSRKPTQNAQKFTFDMAQYLAQEGYIITSGLAQGVDAQAHLGALAQSSQQSGRTIGVMGTGIDVYYPAPHKALFDRIINEGGCIVSELLPGTKPNKHTFPRRNRIVAGLSLGTIVTEAAVQSGSLITARLTSEQGKQVFALPSSIDNPNAEGCHYLIREGATLIYHPQQILEDLSSQLLDLQYFDNDENKPEIDSESSLQSTDKQSAPNDSLLLSQRLPLAVNKTKAVLKKPKSVTISEHLQPLWMHIEFEPQDLDALVTKTKLDTASLLSQLMQLELMGAVVESAGRYQRA